MKKTFYYLTAALAVATLSCKEMQEAQEKGDATGKIIWKQDLELKSDIMTPEVLWAFGRAGGVEISPDQKTIL